MKKLLAIWLFLLAPFLLGVSSSSSVRFSNDGNLGGYQGSDWVNDTANFTPNAAFGTISNAAVFSRREGDSLHVRGYFVSTSPTGGNAAVTFTKYVIDTSKLTGNQTPLGTAQASSNNSGVNYFSAGISSVPFSDGSTTGSIFFAQGTGAGNHIYAAATGSGMATAPYGFHFDFKIPVQGWSTTTPGGTGTRCQLAYDSPNGHDATNTKVRKWSNNRASTGACFTDTATSNGKVVVVTPGTYCVQYHDAASTGQVNMGIVQSGTAGTTNVRLLTYAQGLRSLGATPAANLSNSVSWCGYFANGDFVWFQDDGGADTTNSQGMFTISSVGF